MDFKPDLSHSLMSVWKVCLGKPFMLFSIMYNQSPHSCPYDTWVCTDIDRNSFHIPWGLLVLFFYDSSWICFLSFRLTKSDFREPVNIGSDEMVSMNEMAEIVLSFENKNLPIHHIPGPEGVRGRNSDNTLIKEKLGWAPTMRLKVSVNQDMILAYASSV